MNLLMITRKIDRDDWLAGHSYEWAKKIGEVLHMSGGRLSVICLELGNTARIGDVEVFSLGKENGAGRLSRFFRLQILLARLVPGVDGIFCHQNPEYAIAAAPAAKYFGKKIVSWYTHKSVTWKTRLMLSVSDKVLTASKESFRIASPKVQVLGHGIDTDLFKSLGRRQNSKFSIVSVGRISPVKKLDKLVEAMVILAGRSQAADLSLDIVGDVGLPDQRLYLKSLQNRVEETGLQSIVNFKPAIPHSQIMAVYQHADLFVNLSATGSLDKAVLEAMACECAVITSNEAYFQMLQPFAEFLLLAQSNPELLAEKILAVRRLGTSDFNALTANLRNIVVEKHSLQNLAVDIVKAF